MKANELRIGNLVYDNERIYQIYSGTEIGNKHNDNNFKPIPLTEEWLVKFGFKKVGEYYDKAFNGGALRIDEVQIMIFKGSDYALNIAMDYDCIILPIEVKHVHQLQNLYFALTGEEL